MKMAIVVSVLILVGCMGRGTGIFAEEGVVPDNMTKWGPKLSKEEIARINQLPKAELVEMLKHGDTLYAYAALKRLKANGGWEKNFDLLLSIAAETRGDLIVEGFMTGPSSPVEVSGSKEAKQRVDKFLDFLEAQLKKEKPSVSRRQAIRSMAKTVFREVSLSVESVLLSVLLLALRF